MIGEVESCQPVVRAQLDDLSSAGEIGQTEEEFPLFAREVAMPFALLRQLLADKLDIVVGVVASSFANHLGDQVIGIRRVNAITPVVTEETVGAAECRLDNSCSHNPKVKAFY